MKIAFRAIPITPTVTDLQVLWVDPRFFSIDRRFESRGGELQIVNNSAGAIGTTPVMRLRPILRLPSRYDGGVTSWSIERSRLIGIFEEWSHSVDWDIGSDTDRGFLCPDMFGIPEYLVDSGADVLEWSLDTEDLKINMYHTFNGAWAQVTHISNRLNRFIRNHSTDVISTSTDTRTTILYTNSLFLPINCISLLSSKRAMLRDEFTRLVNRITNELEYIVHNSEKYTSSHLLEVRKSDSHILEKKDFDIICI